MPETTERRTKPKRPPFVPQHTITDVNKPSPRRILEAQETVLRWMAERRARQAAEAAEKSGI